jgi:hypothetical protein
MSEGFQLVPPIWLVSGYSRACARFGEAHPRLDEEAAFHALFEALNWAANIDDYLDMRGLDVDDEILRGIRHPRNRVHHQWADAFERHDYFPPVPTVVLVGGQRGPRHGGRVHLSRGMVADWYWRNADALPPGESDRGKREYQAHLAAKPVRLAIDHLDDLFARLDLEPEDEP